MQLIFFKSKFGSDQNPNVFRKNGEEMRDEKRTLECLKKAARIASQCMDTGVQVQICVELLNHYLFYFERGNSLITVDLLNQVAATFLSFDRKSFLFCFAQNRIYQSNLFFSSIVDCENKRRTSKS